MSRLLGKFLCVLAVFAVADTHLALVQGWAWGTMLHERAPGRGVAKAVESTFSGAEPCPMCCAVQQERNEEQEEAPVPESGPAGKWIPVSAGGGVALYPPRARFCAWQPELRLPWVARKYRPAVPPPRTLG